MSPIFDTVHISYPSQIDATLGRLSAFYAAHQHQDRASLYQKLTITTGRHKHRKKRDVFVPIDPVHKQLHKDLGRFLPGPYHDSVYSYIRQRSRRDAAQCHVASFEVYGVDICDFFPSITESLITRLYTEYLLTILKSGLLSAHISEAQAPAYARMIAWCVTLPHPTKTDEPECVLTLGNEVAPQIARMVLYPIDAEIDAAARACGCRYSRYSDNLYLSHPTTPVPDELKQQLQTAISSFTYTRLDGTSHQPFRIHQDKIRSKLRYRRQQILGVTINHHATLSQDRVEKTRHALHKLFCTLMDLTEHMSTSSISSYDAQQQYLTCTKRARTVFGYLNECAAIDREKYERKFLRKRIAVKALLDETERTLNLYAKRAEVPHAAAQA